MLNQHMYFLHISGYNFRDSLGKEVISLFSTDMKTDSTFYTDANGREVMKRM